MASGNRNRHHNVPRSFTGSDNDLINISHPHVSRHDGYHQVTGHLPLCFIVRKELLSCIDWSNDAQHGLPPGLYEDVFDIVMQPDWRSHHVEGAFRQQSEDGLSDQHFARASIHMSNYLAYESYDSAGAVANLTHGTNLSPRGYSFRRDMEQFFGEKNPADVLRKMLLEKDGSGDWSWSKSMHPSVKSRLLDATKSVRPEKIRKESRQRILNVMQEHRRDLFSCLHSWKPLADDYLNIIQNSTDQVFYAEYLRRRSQIEKTMHPSSSAA